MSESEGFEPDPSAEMDLTPAPQTATPAGDWFAARDRERTHSPDCWQWHPSCAYSAGRREALREFAAHLDEVARTYAGHPEATEQMARYARGTLEAAAEMARHRASAPAGAPADHEPVSLDGAGTPEGTQPREDALRYDERRRVLDAARSITVLMTRTDGSQVAAVQWSRLLQALGLKP